MCEPAVREAAPALLDGDLEAMRETNHRFTAALESGDVEAALRADDASHGVLVRIAGNRALATVLEQFKPTVARSERLRFASLQGRSSVRQHDELIRLCATGDVEGAAAVAHDTWHSLPSAERRPPGVGRHGAMTSSAMRSPSIAKR